MHAGIAQSAEQAVCTRQTLVQIRLPAYGQWRNKTHSKPDCNGLEQAELETDGGENPR